MKWSGRQRSKHETDQEAEKLATSVQQLFLGVISGRRRLLQPPVDNMNVIWNEGEANAVKQMLTYSFIGSAETIHQKMESFIGLTGVNEVMATSHIYDHAARINSYKIFSEVMKQEKLQLSSAQP